MRIRTNIIVQSAAFVAHVLNGTLPFAPEEWKPFVALALAILQGAVSFLGHYSNPDGTPARCAWK